jgi:hypothetical protein
MELTIILKMLFTFDLPPKVCKVLGKTTKENKPMELLLLLQALLVVRC